ncbi:MAG TPA: hypothetical protein VFI52_08510, partial [Gemmatimonadaceae bacterium]|nr:hypothetical protein [Gemmatimonadaceae bacterium]
EARALIDELGMLSPGCFTRRIMPAKLEESAAFTYYTSEIGIKQELDYRGNTYQAEFSGVDVSKE